MIQHYLLVYRQLLLQDQITKFQPILPMMIQM
nr:MAG TPA: hypothetical protein [Caudoviricetes sp.]DAT27307.1 MAG TPA: hypothetical protein [Caudoviricetes sp.]